MGNRLRNPMGETEVWCLLCPRMGRVQQLGLSVECEGEWLGVDRTCLPSAVCATVRVETCTLPYLVPLPLVPSRLGVDLVVGAVRLEPLREALQLRLLRLDVGARLTAARRGRRLAERLRRQESSGAGKL